MQDLDSSVASLLRNDMGLYEELYQGPGLNTIRKRIRIGSRVAMPPNMDQMRPALRYSGPKTPASAPSCARRTMRRCWGSKTASQIAPVIINSTKEPPSQGS